MLQKTYDVDPDGILHLVEDVVPSDSCLVFCPTKFNAENIAILLAELLPRYIVIGAFYRLSLCSVVLQ